MSDNNKSITIAFAADHAGYLLKNELLEITRAAGYQVLDLGTHGPDSVDYPDYGAAAALALADGRAEKAVLVCGSGIGISIAANRNPACRAALVENATAARLARMHNDANALALGARLVGIEVAKDCLNAFLNTPFEGGRHGARVAKLSNTSC